MKNFISIFLISLLCLRVNLPVYKWKLTSVPLPEGFHDIVAIDTKHVIAYSYGTGKIFSTENNAREWTKISQLDSIYFEKLQFINNTTGFIAGENGKIYKTINRGFNWSDISIPSSSKIFIYGMFFFDSTHGIVAGGEMINQRMVNCVFTTINGGGSWQREKYRVPGFITSIIPGENNQLWATAYNMILKKSDTDTSWRIPFFDSTRTIGQIRALAINEHTIIAVSMNGFIIRSIDDGIKWKAEKFTKIRLRDIKFVVGDRWIMAGDANNDTTSATVFTSRDDGATWRKELNPGDIHRISIKNKNIWLAGSQGIIARANFR